MHVRSLPPPPPPQGPSVNPIAKCHAQLALSSSPARNPRSSFIIVFSYRRHFLLMWRHALFPFYSSSTYYWNTFDSVLSTRDKAGNITDQDQGSMGLTFHWNVFSWQLSCSQILDSQKLWEIITFYGATLLSLGMLCYTAMITTTEGDHEIQILVSTVAGFPPKSTWTCGQTTCPFLSCS